MLQSLLFLRFLAAILVTKKQSMYVLFKERWVRRLFISFRYNELLFIIDTCQGASMYERFYSPNIMALASSQVGEDSLSVSRFL